MRKKLSLIGSIMALCSSVIHFGILVYCIAIILMTDGFVEDLGFGFFGDTFTFILTFFIIEAVFLLTSTILNALIIPATRDTENLLKKKKLIIWAIVFNFIASLFIFLEGGLYILIALILIAASILYIIDLSKSKNQKPREQVNYIPQPNPYTNYNQENSYTSYNYSQQNSWTQEKPTIKQNAYAHNTNYAQQNSDTQNRNIEPQNSQSNFTTEKQSTLSNSITEKSANKEKTLEERLQEVDSMLKKDLISDTEYEQIRKRIIEKYLN